MKVCILVNGEIELSQRIKDLISECNIIIAADGGGNFSYSNNIKLDYLIGDFDSIRRDALEYYENTNTQIFSYPCDKDFTDTELCLNKALEVGADEIFYIGAIGDRIDHSLSNIHLLYKTLKKGVKSQILSKTADIFICNDTLKIKGNIGETISILPLLSPINGITLRGFKYLLNGESFEFGDVFGTCNILASEEATISIKEGCLLVIKQYNI
ncbi:MAG: thiamine diphosphokinase [Clostridium sp.]